MDRKIMNLQQNIPLKDYTTFRIGGPAEYFVEVDTIEEVAEALSWAKQNKKEILFIGRGSNCLISDEGFPGLVIKLNLQRLDFNDTQVIVGAGVDLSFLLYKSLEHNLTGLEFVAGIPGTVGGAIRGNAGTYGRGIGDVVKRIRYMDLADDQFKEMLAKEANFDYRHSIFKEKNFLILEVQLELEKGDVDLARKLIQERLQYRQETQPQKPSAGCIFKNVLFQSVDLQALKDRGLDIEQFKKYQKIPAAYLITRTGLPGKVMGGAKISKKHANYIVNTGTATAEEVIMLISFIKQKVRDKYGIQLQEEIKIVF